MLGKNPCESAFAQTAWTQILGAQGRAAESTRRIACLEHLASIYWTPVYAFIRHRSPSDDHALDLTQEYFATFLEKKFLDQIRRERGRFRTFLLTSVRNFLLNKADYAKAARRAPKGKLLSLNIDSGSFRAISLNLSARADEPDTTFMREWARAIVEQARRRLRGENADQARVLECVCQAAGDAEKNYEIIAAELGWSIEQVRKRLHRARKRIAELLREVVRESVQSDGEIDAELRELQKYFS